ncbi:hypothetical protein [Actinomadura oligospora]|uniref:hypothetical protein n=1 Tax=Actinomadura oligospora TaxID=111804 RepID=UPI0012FCA570|nr:hypothetical protein [Actinomadura oligospora]
MYELEVFRRALRGDGASLAVLREDAQAVCVAHGLGSVFRVGVTGDGGQDGVVATVGASGGGVVSKVEIPRAFRVRDITGDSTHFTLTDAEGRSVRGTPSQFGTYVRLLDRECNPRYEEQLAEAFLATPTLPDHGWAEERTPSLRDAVLGTVALSGEGGRYETTVAFGEAELWVTFDGAGTERVAELLPHARGLVEGFAAVARDGLEFLWREGADGTESAEEKARFMDAFEPGALEIFRSGDFGVHFEDDSGEYFMEGYWPAVQFRADRTPVSSTVEA